MDVDKLEAGLETDALVSDKVFGKPFRKPTHGPCCTCQVCGYNNDWDCQCGWSEEIDRAWEIVEKLDSPDLFIALETGTCAEQHVWWCTFWDGDERHYSAAASTPQLAICRAALKTVEGE